MKRRTAWIGVAAFAAAPPLLLRAQPTTAFVEVWKSPSCGCCKAWIAHLEADGFRLESHDVGNNAIRARLKVPAKLGSCHTALAGRYAIEGHVPAADVRRLLRDKPDAVGLAVPGMPLGSPGMDGPAYDNRQEPYDVLLVAHDGSTSVFNRYIPRKERT